MSRFPLPSPAAYQLAASIAARNDRFCAQGHCTLAAHQASATPLQPMTGMNQTMER